MRTVIVDSATVASSRHSFVSDLAELVKARLTLLVLLTTAVGFYLAAEPPVDYRTLFHTVFGTAAAAAGAAALNQWWERRVDALMRRTRTRPIPAGRMAPIQALVLGTALSVFGVVYLAIVCNGLSAVLTAITIVIYIFAYTPLKRASTANTAVGFYLGAEPPVGYRALFHTVFGTAAAAAGAAALNQWWERRVDALMRRTKTRPIPAGRMAPLQALVLGAALSIFGVVYLAIVCNALSAVLAAITIVIYIFAYTPLKRTSTANTVVGAIPGAIPSMIGWAAARGDIGPGAWSLFIIVFLWQMPHFFAIAWMFREDYSRAGFRMISSNDSSGERSAIQSVFFCILLLVLAGLPAFVGVVSYVYQPIELVLSGLFVAVAMRFLRLRTLSAARLLFFASIAYLPLLLAALVLTKI